MKIYVILLLVVVTLFKTSYFVFAHENVEHKVQSYVESINEIEGSEDSLLFEVKKRLHKIEQALSEQRFNSISYLSQEIRDHFDSCIKLKLESGLNSIDSRSLMRASKIVHRLCENVDGFTESTSSNEIESQLKKLEELIDYVDQTYP